MKKKILSKILMVVITASMLLTGCGEQKTDAENVNSTVAQESEAYVQNEEGEKSYTNIDWTWSVSDYELYNTMMKQEEANSELFSGIIDYSDGHQETVKADSVNLIWEDGSTMVVEVEFRGKKFPYKVEIKEIWGDGESLSEEEKEAFKQEGSSGSADSNGSSAEKVIYETAYDVFESNEYQDFYYSIVYEDNSIDELTKRIFMDDIEQMVKDMETLGTLNEFRKFTSLEDFYTFFDEMYAPYGLDRAHRDETNKAAQDKVAEMGGLPLDDAVTFETNESDYSWLEDCVYTIGDTTKINPKDIGGLVDEEITLLHVTATTSTGESIDAGYFSIPKGLDWTIPEKGTVYNYSQYVDLWLSYEEAVNKMR